METSADITFSVFVLLAFWERIIDGLTPARVLPFNELYERCERFKLFSAISEQGTLQVAYGDGELQPFMPSSASLNRHQAIALATFLKCPYSFSHAWIECTHERGGLFRAKFKRDGLNKVSYVSESGMTVRFEWTDCKLQF